MSVPNRLREVRLAAGLTQTDAAEAWGRTQPQVTRVEKADLDTLRIGTVRSYLEAVGARMVLATEPATGSDDSIALIGPRLGRDIVGASTEVAPNQP